jgi:hypothetical protein
MRGVLVVLAVCAALGCKRPSPVAAGSGYGVGIPRTHLLFGKSEHAADDNLGLPGDVEGTDYRPKVPLAWPPTANSRLPLTWMNYRGQPRYR